MMTLNWQAYYQAPNMALWQGRHDSPSRASFFQIVQPLDLLRNTDATPHENTFALLGFCCDEGIRRNLGRIGAKEGPDVIRKCIATLSLAKQNFFCYDAGNILCFDHDLESAQLALAEAIAMLLSKQITPIVLGGGHEVAFGHYQGIAKFLPKNDLAIVNFDAHFDMRPLLPNHQGSSGTPFLQIAQAQKESNNTFYYSCIGIQSASNIQALFDTAKQYHVETYPAENFYLKSPENGYEFVNHLIDRSLRIYVSLCLDVFASPYAPGVSAPQSFGLIPWHVIPLVRQLASSRKVISYDIAELSPNYDIDQRTAKLAAGLIYEIIHYHRNK